MNDRYGEFRGEVFWDFVLSNLYQAIIAFTLIFIFLAIVVVIECFDEKREYRVSEVKAKTIWEFAEELKTIKTDVLRLMVHQHNVYSEEKIKLIRNELQKRENEETR